VTRKGHRVPAVFFRDQGKLNAARLATLFPQGISVIAKYVDAQVSTLRALCDSIEARIGEKVNMAAVVTMGDGGALHIHYDTPDVLVLQVEGSKRWRIYDKPVVDPVAGMPKPIKSESAVIFDEVLRQGDLLYVPAGYWHHCDNGPDLSLHLAVLFAPPTGSDGVRALFRQALMDPIYRVRFARLGSAERAAHEAVLKAHLMNKIEHTSFSELIAQGAKADLDLNSTVDTDANADGY
jgi:ribosomal protein L16 Arg81 hydroxylase